MNRILVSILCLLCCCIAENTLAQDLGRSTNAVSGDSLKNLFEKSTTDVDKARFSLEMTGFLISQNHFGDDSKQWLQTAERYVAKTKNAEIKGYWYIYASYLLSSKYKDIKFKYLDSAETIFPAEFHEGRNFMRYLRTRFYIAYDMKREAAAYLTETKIFLEKQRASGYGMVVYFAEMAQLAWNNENYIEAKKNYQAQIASIEASGEFKAGRFNTHSFTGDYGNMLSSYASACTNAGLCYYRLDSFQKAVYYYKKGIENFSLLKDHPGLVWAYQLIGECYTVLGMPKEAEPWFFKSLNEIKEEAKISTKPQAFALQECLSYLYDILPQNGEYKQLIKLIDSGVHEFEKIKDLPLETHISMAELTLQKAKTYALQNKYEEVVSTVSDVGKYISPGQYTDAEHKGVKYNELRNLAHFYMIKAWLAFKLQKNGEYAVFRDKALDNIKAIKDWHFKISAYNLVSWYLINAKDYLHIISNHSAYLAHLDTKKDITGQKNLAGELADAYANIHNYDSAYKYRRLFSRLSDSIRSSQQFYAIANLTEKYRSEAENIHLKHQNEQLSKEHAQKIIWFLTGLLIMSLLAAALFVNRQRLINLHNLEKAHKEKLFLDMVERQKQLSDTTLELVRSNNVYGGLLQDVEQIGKKVKGDKRKHLKQLIVGQKMHTQEEGWRQFNIQFEKMNADFYKNLQEIAPGLTESEKKICALMAVGLSNKEICAVTFQPINSIYTYKNRLRKKFSSQSDEELSERLAKHLSNV